MTFCVSFLKCPTSRNIYNRYIIYQDLVQDFEINPLISSVNISYKNMFHCMTYFAIQN